MPFVRRGVLPGFGLSFGITLATLGVLVVLPLAALMVKALGLGPAGIVAVLSDPRTLAAFSLSFGAAIAAAATNVVVGLLLAWVLVRYRFPGRTVVDAFVDLPFALPTAVAGIALTAIYSKTGVLGRPLHALGIDVAFTRIGVFVALVFVGLPFVVRSVQPVLAELESDVEEAAATLGAGRWATFRRVLLPALTPALLSGFGLAFARAAGE